jgi:hypothetical protein|tara:strand:+ start:571 stop:675 length:105 start_codon:yes stop_codon:yes gene_type:complete
MSKKKEEKKDKKVEIKKVLTRKEKIKALYDSVEK